MSAFKRGDKVIFKQREARHLAHRNLPWEYEEGDVVNLYEEARIADVLWLQGHHSRHDRVPYDDIVAVFDKSKPSVKIGPFSGPSRLLQEIVEEGS